MRYVTKRATKCYVFVGVVLPAFTLLGALSPIPLGQFPFRVCLLAHYHTEHSLSFPRLTSRTKVSIALAVASTSIVPSRFRGKLSGLYGTAESFGRFTSAVGFPVLFAWSISSDNLGWVDHRFVFYSSALALGVATVVAWRTLPAEIFWDKSAVENVKDAIRDAGLTPKSDPKGFVSCSRPAGEMDLI